MSCACLLDLLYITDRRAFARFGRPVTYDRLVSTQSGPILSHTLNLIKKEPLWSSYWFEYISISSDYEASLTGAGVPSQQLSPAEEALLDEVFKEFGQLNQADIRKHTCGFAEYKRPLGSETPIDISKLLVAQGVSEEDAEAIIGELSALAHLEQILTLAVA